MQTLETVVNFVAANVSTESVNAATGDFLNLSIILAAVVFAMIAFGAAVFRKSPSYKNCGVGNYTAQGIAKSTSAIFAVLAAFTLIMGSLAVNEKANADDLKIADASKTIQAAVDELTGEVTFDCGWIRQAGDKAALVTGVNVEYAQDVSVAGSPKWTVALDGNTIYDNIVGVPTVGQKITIKNSTLSFAVEGLSANAAKDLIDKDVLKISFLTDIVLTPTQEKADNKIIDDVEDFKGLILDESEFPSTELLLDDKEIILEKIEQIKLNAQIALRQTEDPLEIQKIVENLDSEINKLLQEANDIKTKTAAEKNSFAVEQNAAIDKARNNVTNNPWLLPSDVNNFSLSLDNAEINLDKFMQSTTKDEMKKTKEDTLIEIKEVNDEYPKVAAENEKKVKEDSIKNAQEQANNFNTELNDPEIWDPTLLLLEQRVMLEKKLKEVTDEAVNNLNKASSLNEVEEAKKNFESRLKDLRDSAQKGCDETSKIKADTKKLCEDTLAEINMLLEDDDWVSDEDKAKYVAELKSAEDLIQKILEATSRDDMNKIQAEFFGKVNDTKSKFEKEQKSASDKVKQTYLDDAKAAKKAAVAEIESYGADIWDDIKDQILREIKLLEDNYEADINNAVHKSDLEDLKKVFNNSLQNILSKAKIVSEETKKYKEEQKKKLIGLVEELKDELEKAPAFEDFKDQIAENLDNIVTEKISALDSISSKNEFMVAENAIRQDLNNSKKDIILIVNETKTLKLNAVNTIRANAQDTVENIKKLDNISEEQVEDYAKSALAASEEFSKKIQEEAAKSKDLDDINADANKEFASILEAAQDQVAPWKLTATGDISDYMFNKAGDTITLDQKIELSDEETRTGALATDPVYSVNVVEPEGTTDIVEISKNQDGYPVLSISNTVVKGSVFKVEVTGTYNAVVDSGNTSSLSFNQFDIAIPFDAYWGVSTTSNGTTLHLSKTVSTTTPNGDDSILNGYSGIDDLPWYEYLSSISSVYVDASASGVQLQPTSTKYLFAGLTACNEITQISRIDTSTATDMSHMFENDTLLNTKNLDLINTSSAENMEAMFKGCANFIYSSGFKSYDTSKVKNMSHMFEDCTKLKDFGRNWGSSWSTPELLTMEAMFSGCTTITEVDINGFNTDNVTNTSSLFKGDSGLSVLSMGNINTSRVITMQHMFSDCSALSNLSLDWTSLETDSATDLSYMFKGCSNLSIIDLSKLKLSEVTNMSHMFDGCKNAYNISAKATTRKKALRDTSYMFKGCSSASSIDFGNNFNTDNVTDMSHMFEGCIDVSSITIGSFDTANVKNMSCMFAGCSSISSINFGSSFNTAKVTDMSHMFESCEGFTTLSLNRFNTAAVTDMTSMFSSCINIATIDFGNNFNTQNVELMEKMFYNCKKLDNLNLTEFSSDTLSNMNMMFAGVGCQNDNGCWIKFGSDFDTNNVSTMSKAFSQGKFRCGETSQTDLLNCLDLSYFKNNNLKNVDEMFAATDLNYIFVDNTKWIAKDYDSSLDTFNECIYLKAKMLGDSSQIFEHGDTTDYDSGMYAKCYISVDKPGLFTDISLMP